MGEGGVFGWDGKKLAYRREGKEQKNQSRSTTDLNPSPKRKRNWMYRQVMNQPPELCLWKSPFHGLSRERPRYHPCASDCALENHLACCRPQPPSVFLSSGRRQCNESTSYLANPRKMPPTHLVTLPPTAESCFLSAFHYPAFPRLRLSF